MSGKRPSDACLDFESRDPGVLPEQPLLKRRKRFLGDVLSEAMMEIKQESPEDSQISDSGFQPGNSEREVDEESNKTADTEGNQKVPISFQPVYSSQMLPVRHKSQRSFTITSR